jgi:uridine kinase
MIGDKLVITDYHRQAAEQIAEQVIEMLKPGDQALSVSIAGESGGGKSETAYCLEEALDARGKKCLVLGQDDYYKLPPKSNHRRRKTDISWVGPHEVNLELMALDILAVKEHPDQPLVKPLIDFYKDRIGTETIHPDGVEVVIAEGTYTTLLPYIDLRVFIDCNYHQTRKARLVRDRDSDVEWLNEVLEIEHRELRHHRARAHLVIPPPEDTLT